MAPSDDKTHQPTAAEAYLFYSIVKNLNSRPDINWEGVARDNGFKNSETAKVRYGQVKRKLNIENWAPPVKTPGSGKSSAKASGSGVGKTEPDNTPVKLPAATGAGVKKRARAINARKKPAAKAKGKTVDDDSDDSDDSETEAKTVVKTPNNPVGGAVATPISIGSSTPSTGDSDTMRPARGVTAALARLSPTPAGRAQSQINLDNYINSLQTQTAPHNQINQPPHSLYPARGVQVHESVYAKAAIPVQGPGNTWTTHPVSPAAHQIWFDGLRDEDLNRFMDEAVQYHVRQSKGFGMEGGVNKRQCQMGGANGAGYQPVQNGSNGSATPTSTAAAPAANFKGKKLADIPYHPDFLDRQDQEKADFQLPKGTGFH